MKKLLFLLLLPVCLRAQLPFAETLPSGTSGQTLRHNGTSYVSSSVITNNGTNVGIGASPDGTYKLYTSGAAKFAGRIYATGTGAYSVSTSPNLLLENTTSSTGRPFYLLSSDLGKLEFYSTPNSTPIMSLSNLGDVTVSKRALLTEKWGASGSGNEMLGRNSSGGLCKITLGSGLTLTDSTLSASGGGGGGTPGGNTSELQYNNAGSFDGQANITTTEGATTGNELSIAGGSVTTGKALNVTANALTTGSVLNVSSTSTAAGSNTQTGLNVSLSGANSTSTQTTYGAQISNTHTGASSTNVGLNVDASGGTDNYSILLGANTAQNIYGARRTSDAGGSDLRIQAGGAFSGGTNRTGGNLLLSGGISTGSTGSEIQFLTATNIGSGTTDRNPTQKMVLNRSGFLGIGVTSPSYLLDGSGGVMRWNSAGTATSPNASSTACFQNNSSGFSYIEVKNASTSALFFGAISSGGAGRIGWHGTGGLNFNSAPVLNPGTVFDRFFIKDDGGQALQYLGGGTSAAGTATFISSGIFSATSTATVTNTTTEGTLLGAVSGTKTLPTNFFTAGKKVTVRVSGTVATDAVTPGTLNVQLKFGSTVIAQTTATTMLAVTGTRNWTADFEVVCRSTGASGTLQAGGNFEFYSAAGTKQFWECAQNLVSSFNTTSTHVVDVTATWGTADADNTISGTQAILIIED